jgi:hypothetical protein
MAARDPPRHISSSMVVETPVDGSSSVVRDSVGSLLGGFAGLDASGCRVSTQKDEKFCRRTTPPISKKWMRVVAGRPHKRT